MFKKIAQTVAIITAALLVVLWSGYVVSALWLWFIVPTGMKAITLSQASGIYLIGQILTYKSSERSSEDWRRWAYALGVPAVALAIGWTIHAIA